VQARQPTKTTLAERFKRALSFAKTESTSAVAHKEQEVDVVRTLRFCRVCAPLRIFICFVQILVPKITHGMTTQTGSQHAHNEDRGVAIIDLLTTHPGTDEVRLLLLPHSDMVCA
jgi:hypothetical protein